MKKKIIKKSTPVKMKKGGKIRKFQNGGMEGKGPLASNYKSTEDVAKSAVEKLTSTPGVVKPTPSTLGPVTATLTKKPTPKKRTDGFTSDAQKAAYIKSAKAMLAKNKTVDDLVKMKFGTKEGLAALGIKDSQKPTAPKNTNKPTTPKKTTDKSKTSAPKYDNTKALELKKKGLEMKKKGQALAVKGRKEAAGSDVYTYLTTEKSKDPIKSKNLTFNKDTGFAVTRKNINKKGDKTIIVEKYDKEGNTQKVIRKYIPSDPNKKTSYTEFDKKKGDKVGQRQSPGARTTFTGRLTSLLTSFGQDDNQDLIKSGSRALDKKDIFKILQNQRGKKFIQKGLDGSGLSGLIVPAGIAKAGTGAKYISSIKNFLKKNPKASIAEAEAVVKKTFSDWAKSGSNSATSSTIGRTKNSISKSKNITRKPKPNSQNLDDILKRGESTTRTRSEWLKQGSKNKSKSLDEVLAVGEKGSTKFKAYTKKPKSAIKEPLARGPKKSINKSKDISQKYNVTSKGSTSRRLNYKKAVEMKPLPKKTPLNKVKDLYSKYIKPKQEVFGDRGQYSRLEDMKASEAYRNGRSHGYKNGGKIKSTKNASKKRK
jgi:hypothetical protein